MTADIFAEPFFPIFQLHLAGKKQTNKKKQKLRFKGDFGRRILHSEDRNCVYFLFTLIELLEFVGHVIFMEWEYSCL